MVDIVELDFLLNKMIEVGINSLKYHSMGDKEYIIADAQVRLLLSLNEAIHDENKFHKLMTSILGMME